MALIVGVLGTFSLPIVAHISMFWPATVFQVVGGLWFGGWGMVMAVLFPLFSNAIGGVAFNYNLAMIPANLIQGGLTRICFQHQKWDPSLPSLRVTLAFVVLGPLLSNLLGALSFILISQLMDPKMGPEHWGVFSTWVLGNSLPRIFLGIPLLKIFSPLVIRSGLFFPRMWRAPKSLPVTAHFFRDVPLAVKFLIGLLVAGFLPMALLAAFSVSEQERHLNVFLTLGLFLCITLAGGFARTIQSSMDRILKRLKEIGEGDFREELRIQSQDELGRIGANIQDMARKLDHLYAEQRELFLGTILALAEAVDARDPYTRGHSDRVSHYALETAGTMGLSHDQRQEIYFAGILHDIGKIGIPEAVLNHQGPLDQEKAAQMKTHPQRAVRILGLVKTLEKVLPLVRSHHECYGGSGYPFGLRGEAIPLGARILAVADAYDAMTSDRPYRKGMEEAEALRRLKEGAGSQFDPQVVEAFLSAIVPSSAGE
jgi:HD-GYP domain-containing protein (c-di-GMP phosphodiesterase class II)